MRRIIFVTQLIDGNDTVLGFVDGQIRALAAHVDVLVIANEVRTVPRDLGAEVVSLGKEHGRHRAARGARYVGSLLNELRHKRADAIIAHMCPVYATLAAPLGFAYRVPTLLWFVHPDDTMTLRVAERLSSGVITAFDDSYPRRTSKVHAIGHAIDTDAFEWSPQPQRAEGQLRMLALGRTSPVKSYDVMIRAIALARRAGVDARLRIAGASVTLSEKLHREDLVRCIANSGGGVELLDGVAQADVPALLRDTDVVLNATQPGSADKVVFQAMATGRPVITSSPAFASLVHGVALPLTFPDGDAAALADRIAVLASASTDVLELAGITLRRAVVGQHSLSHWAAQVLDVAQSRRA